MAESGKVHDIIKNIKIPEMVQIRQAFAHQPLNDICDSLEKQFIQKKIADGICPGMTVAVTAGSRGISHYALILRELIKLLQQAKAKPFIVAAMGSHGGATVEGQKAILDGYGITESYCGCPVKIGTECVCIGKTENGENVFIDKFAAEADAIVVVNRIKPHTAFRGPYESGLMKMLAIGLGKQKGAEACHKAGFQNMAHMVPEFGHTILVNKKVLFATAIIEDAYDETSELVLLKADEIESEEPGLLQRARKNMPRILVDNVDVLVVGQIGKNYSGDGMDPNISGTFATAYASGGIKTQRVAVLDISDSSHGNGVGFGMADVSTKRAYRKFDREMSYPNALTCLVPQVVKIPMIFENDRECIQAAIKLCADIDYEKVKLVYIHNTLKLDEVFVSESLVEEVEKTAGADVIKKCRLFCFDEYGNLPAY